MFAARRFCQFDRPWHLAPLSPCQSDAECEPGETACDGRAVITCQEDGTWGQADPCMDGDTFISCFQHPRTGEASCMDAICTGWALREAYNYNDDPALVGTCTTDGRLMACDTNGRLKDAAECPNGSTCSPYDDSYVNGQFDGYRGGKCQTQCQDGAQECIGATGEYRVCNEGLWETTRCADGASCNQEGNTVFCGQCVAGRTGCSGDQIVTCDDNGMWGDPPEESPRFLTAQPRQKQATERAPSVAGGRLRMRLAAGRVVQRG